MQERFCKMNAHYVRHHELQQGEEQVLAWLLGPICEMDHDEKGIWSEVANPIRSGDRLANDKLLLPAYYLLLERSRFWKRQAEAK